MTIGKPHVHYAATDSTNARARALAAAGAPHGTLVTAGAQTAGRGRQGRAWTAAPGDALLMSLLVRRVDPLLPLAAAVGVCESLAPVDALIKWPNDVWVGTRRKVAGILIEGRPQEGWAVIGIGLNVLTAPGELGDAATSLAAASIEGATVADALAALLAALERWIDAPPDEILAAWRARDALRGSPVTWSGGAGSGTAAGITDTGALLVETDAGPVELDAGEVHLGSY
jgi:BirA family biotin operon repressor/biotin-[acetyl-CoA-carboxylase] ligase